MQLQLSRRKFLKWTGIAIASTPALSACTKNGTSAKNTLPTAPPQKAQVIEPVPGTFKVGDKTYPFKDPKTGELLYHEPIRFTPRPGLARKPLTTPVDLLQQQPKRIESVNGVLAADLDIKFVDVVVDGQTMNLRTYNGTFPGPTLAAKPGDILRIRELNNLPPEPPEPPHDINHPHGFNDVNLHTHGVNDSPEDSEDNIFLTIHPGEIFGHEIHIPADHPTGTFWYHPHKHGATGCQVGSGMAGLLTLTDPKTDIRSLPEVGAAKEVAFIFQELYIKDRPDGVGEVPGIPTDVMQYYYGDAIRNEQTVNGVACMEVGLDRKVITPEIHVRPGEVQHWRLLHGGVSQNWPFAIDGHQSHIVAYDGVTLDSVETVDEFLFAPGQRRDILVQASTTPGTYAVKRKAYKQAAEVNTWPEITLFNMIVDGAPVTMGLPTKLNPPRKRLPYVADKEIVYKRDVAFSFIDDTAKGTFLFTIDNKVFKAGRVDYSMVLGTAEEWTISNNPDSDHPFHIHVNWFELLKSIDGAGKETVYNPPIWMDTANIPANGKIVVRMRFENFQGKAVFHCHFLTHEDEGMMATIEIVDGSPATATIPPDGGTFVSNDFENRVQVRFLKGSVLANTDITYQRLASPNFPNVNPAIALPKGLADYNTFFTLTGKQGGTIVSELSRPATMEVKYSSAQVDVNVPLDNINLYYYDTQALNWVTDGVSVVARADNLLTCSTKRLGQFAVTAKITP